MEDYRVIECDFSDPEHIKSLINLMNEYMTGPTGGRTEIYNNNQEIELIKGLRDHPSAFALFVKDDFNEIAGLANCFLNFATFDAKPYINIHDIIITKTKRGSGLGHKLLRGIEILARVKQCSKITLEVRIDNEIAQKTV